jgi:polar amino acid transport system permease protein
MTEIGNTVAVLMQGVWVTVQVMLGSACVGTLLALVAGIIQLVNKWYLRLIARVYVEIFRGSSAVVQLFWIFFVLPFAGIYLPPVVAAVIALGLNTGSYGAEIVRGALQSVPKGQWEAATALNMTALQRLRLVVLPQAVAPMLPPYGNLLIELLKATSLVSLVTVADITERGQLLRSATAQSAQIYGVMLILYFVLASLIMLPIRLGQRVVSQGDVVTKWSGPL